MGEKEKEITEEEIINYLSMTDFNPNHNPTLNDDDFYELYNLLTITKNLLRELIRAMDDYSLKKISEKELFAIKTKCLEFLNSKTDEDDMTIFF